MAYAWRQSPEEQVAPGEPHTAPPLSAEPFVFMKAGALQASANTLVTPKSALICWANQSCPASWPVWDIGRYVGVALGPPGLFGSMVLPESALIQLRKIVRPAPDAGLYSRPSACCWTDEEAFITVCASPNASEAPNPVIVWNVVAPLIVAVSAAAAELRLLATKPACAQRYHASDGGGQ